jgi:hypothetical protein
MCMQCHPPTLQCWIGGNKGRLSLNHDDGLVHATFVIARDVLVRTEIIAALQG